MEAPHKEEGPKVPDCGRVPIPNVLNKPIPIPRRTPPIRRRPPVQPRRLLPGSDPASGDLGEVQCDSDESIEQDEIPEELDYESLRSNSNSKELLALGFHKSEEFEQIQLEEQSLVNLEDYRPYSPPLLLTNRSKL
eukprot:CAMPEP_0201283528 /NCGR_PEP_ID=MMETSP1317-20130820/8764_1 /ASSEMBLY_ACC=CAM_ASM_000770 /TAXON_ID=187299 /ORGANISM="Undescribed Undescribed, Strain Undescribed" /LENGTH=135 /DNA_ID=CAMNT_0047600033 /DNA_START=690 /DNA_END=1098 /DNA_ORIENTATION=-